MYAKKSVEKRVIEIMFTSNIGCKVSIMLMYQEEREGRRKAPFQCHIQSVRMYKPVTETETMWKSI